MHSSTKHRLAILAVMAAGLARQAEIIPIEINHMKEPPSLQWKPCKAGRRNGKRKRDPQRWR